MYRNTDPDFSMDKKIRFLFQSRSPDTIEKQKR